MSNINTVYAYFDTYNYTGVLNTLSYTLPFATFTFIPRLETIDHIFSTRRVVWDFGDGSIMEAVTANHAYTTAGNYKVTCSLYTGDGQCYINSYFQMVDVYDFVPDNINIQVNNSLNYTLTSGQITSPIYVTNSISYQHLVDAKDNKTIVAFCSGCDDNYFELSLDKQAYGHLQPYSSFYLKKVGLNGITDFFEISSFQTTTTPLYCKLLGTDIVYTDVSDIHAFFCGITGYQDVYFKSDVPKSQVNLFFGYQPGEIQEFTNTSTVGISAKVIENTSFKTVSINANGITSEGNTSNLFPIGTNKFGNTKIGFVAKLKDSSNYTNKQGTITHFIAYVILGDGDYFNSIVTVGTDTPPSGSFYKGYFTVDFSAPSITTNNNTVYHAPYAFENVALAVDIDLDLNGNGVFGTTEATSNTFNLYSKDYYNITKKGEDIDMTQQFKDIAMQPLFLDNPVLFDDFMGSIVGNLSSPVGSTLGKKTYEKIQNFVDNNSTLDYAGIQSLVSLIKMVGSNDNIQYDSSNYLYPADIGRLVDLLSINFNRLKGFADLYNYDFKTYGYQDSEIYGSNLGNEISTLNYTITAGVDIVAFEKYSGIFKRLNTYLPFVASLSVAVINNTLGTYKLSSYNSTWGWGLVTPEGATVVDLSKYYLFYEHNPTINGTITNNTINYNDITNTLSNNISSYEDWSQPGGIISNILSNQLYTGLNLFN